MKVTNNEVQILIAVLELLRKGVLQLSGEQLMQAAEIITKFRDHVDKVIESANAETTTE